MKSFYKISFLVAGGMIAIGLMFGLVGVAFGGNHQLSAMAENGELSYSAFPGKWDIHWKDKDESVESADRDSSNLKIDEKDVYPSDEIKNLEIRIGSAELDVIVYDGTELKVDSNRPEEFEYGMTGSDTFILKSKGTEKHWNVVNRKAKLYLPKNMKFETVDVKVGAGDVEMEEFDCRTLKAEVGAGACSMDHVKSETIDFKIGAGSGELSDAVIGEGNYDIGVGQFDFSGKITGDTSIQCGMGCVSMDLEGQPEDYNYDVICSMGSVEIGREQIEAFSGNRAIDNNSDITFDINCNMGSVELDF